MVTGARIVVACALTFVACGVNASQLGARVDTTTAALGEPVTLTLTLHDSDVRLRADGTQPNVDLGALKNSFDLGKPRTINRMSGGRAVSELHVELFAKRPGRHVIPSIAAGSLRTRPLSVEIKPAPGGAAPEVFSRAGANKSRAWAGEQIVVWLDFYRRIETENVVRGDIFDAEPIAPELMGARELPQMTRVETFAGERYDVLRQAWALFPRDAGKIVLHVPDLWVHRRDGKRLRLPRHSVHVDVRALPANVPGDIIVGKPQITQHAPDERLEVNALTSWSVKVRAPVAIDSLPDALLFGSAPPNVRLFADRAVRSVEDTPEGSVATADYVIAVTPLAAGVHVLQPPRIAYFDPARGTVEEETPPPVRFTVSPPSDTNQRAPTNFAPGAPVAHAPRPGAVWITPALLGAAAICVYLALVFVRGRVRTTPASGAVPAAPYQAPAFHPLQRELLHALGGPSLELGLARWESVHGVDDALRAAVNAVQRLRYGGTSDADADALQSLVEAALKRLRAQRTPSTAPAQDPWLPESFTARL